MRNDGDDFVAGRRTAEVTGRDFSFTLKPQPGEGMPELFNRLADTLRNADQTMVKLMVFGLVSAHPAADQAMRRVFGEIKWPITWVEGAGRDDHPIAGLQVFAFRSDRVKPITLNGCVVGAVFEDDGVRHCLLGGLGPNLAGDSRADQFRQTLEVVEAALEQVGFALGDIIRTWFYLDELLSWYDQFNAARTEAYAGIKFRVGSSPASTAISGRNPAATALVAGVWAVQPLGASTQVAEIASPLQCPAPAYGSTFSRAVEISSLHDRRLLISGTASIAPDGQTLWPGNIRRQIELTMEVVEGILVSRGYAFSDITRATAYFKNPADVPEFSARCADQGLVTMPVLAVQGGICRDDLLFELEADARKRKQGG
jgi:enamine deaminase RidA (YjgF/YER057c/UK114 family)